MASTSSSVTSPSTMSSWVSSRVNEILFSVFSAIDFSPSNREIISGASGPVLRYTPAVMLAALKRRVQEGLAATIRERFDVDHDPIVEVPPRRELGDLAFPGALQLAREL